MDNDINVKKKYSIQVILSIALLLILTGGFTYAFFNYTRTGNSNILRLGEIVFHYSEGNNISLSNVFPIKVERDSNGNITNQEGIGEVEILIDGRTTYSEGIEYIVRAVNVNNGTTKKLPIGIDIKVETNGEGNNDNLGIEDSDYFQNRGSYTTSHYNKLLNSDALTEESDILVGFIAGNNNNTNNSVNGKIIIKAYIDDSKILVSDTYDGTESDNMGTSSSMAEGKTVFTTSEWNLLQTSGVSFQIKVEANEGIWVEHGTNNVTNPRLFAVRLLDNGTYEITGFAKESSSETSSESSGETSDETSSEPSGETSGETSSESSSESSGETSDETSSESSSEPSGETSGETSSESSGETSGETSSESSGETSGETSSESSSEPSGETSGETSSESSGETSGEASSEVNHNIVIPSEIDGIRVTAIGDHAFAYNQLTSVEIPNSVTTIGEFAFYNNQLTSVTIGNSVTTIGDYAFASNQLTSVEIPNSVTTIGEGTFSFNHITSVVLPNSVTTIGMDAFSFNKLTSIEIPNSVTTIGDSAFSANKLTSVEMPNSVTTIGGGAFASNQLTSIEIPNSITTIGNHAFASNQLTSIEIPNSVTTIGNYAFDSNQLRSIEIPNSITTIGNGAFGNNKLASVEIPNSVTTIEDYAFQRNYLSSLVIPDSVTTIGELAFEGNPYIFLRFNNRACSTIKGMSGYSWRANRVYGTDGVCN